MEDGGSGNIVWSWEKEDSSVIAHRGVFPSSEMDVGKGFVCEGECNLHMDMHWLLNESQKKEVEGVQGKVGVEDNATTSSKGSRLSEGEFSPFATDVSLTLDDRPGGEGMEMIPSTLHAHASILKSRCYYLQALLDSPLTHDRFLEGKSNVKVFYSYILNANPQNINCVHDYSFPGAEFLCYC